MNIYLREALEMKQSNSKKYKALMLDVDGTLIPNKKDGMPSEKIKEAISKASKKIKISIATSRPNFLAIQIIDHLSLTAPCILAGGGHIYDPIKKTMTVEVLLESKTYYEIEKIIKALHFDAMIYDADGNDYPILEYKFKKPMHVWAGGLSPNESEILFKEISRIPSISVHKLTSWRKGNFDIMATPPEATKQHGILKVAEILGIKTHEIIGVGDGYNDFPLLMACGLKVAMGNAVDDLKAIADYVAPPVEEDGVADVIERFVFKNNLDSLA